MNKSKTIVYLATKTNMIDNGIYQLIKNKHGKKTNIKIVRSPRVFTTNYGLVTLIRQNINTGIVYVIKNEITNQSFDIATQSGLPFNVLFKNERNKWDCIHLRKTIKNDSANKRLVING